MSDRQRIPWKVTARVDRTFEVNATDAAAASDQASDYLLSLGFHAHEIHVEPVWAVDVEEENR